MLTCSWCAMVSMIKDQVTKIHKVRKRHITKFQQKQNTNLPPEIRVSQIEQRHVAPELWLVGLLLGPHIRIHVLEGLQTLGQVIRVQLLIELSVLQVGEPRGAVRVEACARLHQLDRY